MNFKGFKYQGLTQVSDYSSVKFFQKKLISTDIQNVVSGIVPSMNGLLVVHEEFASLHPNIKL